MRPASLLMALCAALGCQAGAAQSSVAGDEIAARVECGSDRAAGCRADLLVYIGWRVFEAQCATCHAADARGSSYAPDLLERLRAKTERDFVVALEQGYLGPRSTMPPRGRDPNVAPYLQELWAYLAARRSGTLPAGRVELLATGSVDRESP